VICVAVDAVTVHVTPAMVTLIVDGEDLCKKKGFFYGKIVKMNLNVPKEPGQIVKNMFFF
jgi:hypothetical protein